MSVTEFTKEMVVLGLSEEEIVYLIEIDSLRCATGMYADLGTLASLIGRLMRPDTVESASDAVDSILMAVHQGEPND